MDDEFDNENFDDYDEFENDTEDIEKTLAQAAKVSKQIRQSISLPNRELEKIKLTNPDDYKNNNDHKKTKNRTTIGDSNSNHSSESPVKSNKKPKSSLNNNNGKVNHTSRQLQSPKKGAENLVNKTRNVETKIVTFRKGYALKALGIRTNDYLGKDRIQTHISMNLNRGKKVHKISMTRIEILSRPKSAKPSRLFANDDDENNCTFMPKPSRTCHEDNEYQKGSNFLQRTVAMEAARVRKLEFIRGEKEYECKRNKKVCPNCDVYQSYAEYRDKKKKCSSCGGFFRSENSWYECQEQFLDRMEQHHAKRTSRLEKILKEVEFDEKIKGRMKKTKQQKYYDDKIRKKRNLNTSK